MKLRQLKIFVTPIRNNLVDLANLLKSLRRWKGAWCGGSMSRSRSGSAAGGNTGMPERMVEFVISMTAVI